MKLTMLGTGNASAIKYYNTCFVLSDNNEHLLVDGGGGNEVVRRINEAGIGIENIHTLFITHKHFDHFLGALWVIKIIGGMIDSNDYTPPLHVYAGNEVIELIKELCERLLHKSFIHFFDQDLIILHKVQTGDTANIIGHDVTFFNVGAQRTEQFGFSMKLDGDEFLTCLGDENLHEEAVKYAKGADWLMHEGFCLYSDKDELNPYKKGHSTIKDVAERAQELGVKNLILYHTEDSDATFGVRKDLYTLEAEANFSGNVYVPDDMETLEI